MVSCGCPPPAADVFPSGLSPEESVATGLFCLWYSIVDLGVCFLAVVVVHFIRMVVMLWGRVGSTV